MSALHDACAALDREARDASVLRLAHPVKRMKDACEALDAAVNEWEENHSCASLLREMRAFSEAQSAVLCALEKEGRAARALQNCLDDVLSRWENPDQMIRPDILEGREYAHTERDN